MYQTEDMPKGWVKPAAKPTLESLKARVAELRAELANAEGQLREMEEGERLEALLSPTLICISPPGFFRSASPASMWTR